MCLQEMSKDYLSPADPVGASWNDCTGLLHHTLLRHVSKVACAAPALLRHRTADATPPHSRDSDDDDSEACDEARACPVPGVT